MRELLRRWWPLIKVLLFVAILAGVGWQFARILRSEELQQTDRSRSPGAILWAGALAARPAGLVLCGALYLAGLGFSAYFWIRLLRLGGQSVAVLPAVRGYYIGHLGKYVPGKTWAMVLRTGMAVEAGARPGVAVLTSVYEVLTTIAAGALVGAVLAVWNLGDDPNMLWRAAALLALAGIPILPGVFNRVVRRASARFVKDAPPLDLGLSTPTLLLGLALASCGWLLLGASLEVLLHALAPERHAWSGAGWVRSTTFIAVSYVAGFIVPTPGGLGVREGLLALFLAPVLGEGPAVVAAVLLRVLWTVAELLCAAVVFWLPRTGVREQESEINHRVTENTEKTKDKSIKGLI